MPSKIAKSLEKRRALVNYESAALPTELRRLNNLRTTFVPNAPTAGKIGMSRGNLACRVALDSHIENITPSTPTGRTTSQQLRCDWSAARRSRPARLSAAPLRYDETATSVSTIYLATDRISSIAVLVPACSGLSGAPPFAQG
jgi:hypothetical protein